MDFIWGLVHQNSFAPFENFFPMLLSSKLHICGYSTPEYEGYETIMEPNSQLFDLSTVNSAYFNAFISDDCIVELDFFQNAKHTLLLFGLLTEVNEMPACMLR